MGASKRAERELDTLEDRLMGAPDGLHLAGPPAASDPLARADLGDAAGLWERWDGIDFGHGEARIYSLSEIERATREAREEATIRAGERVVGASGSDLFVLAADPWEEGAEVLLIEDDGARHPYASSVAGLAAMLVGDATVLFDDDGEYRDDIFGEDGELTTAAQRKLQRRRLDRDEDAPYARWRLAQLLRRAGELPGARRELELTLRRAPNYLWAQLELGRVQRELGASDRARAAFAEVVRLCGDDDDGVRAFALAWQALLAPAAERSSLAAQVIELYPSFALAQEQGARAALEANDRATARERVELGLAVLPGHLGLLALRRELE